MSVRFSGLDVIVCKRSLIVVRITGVGYNVYGNKKIKHLIYIIQAECRDNMNIL